MMLRPKLLEFLKCPETLAPLAYLADEELLVSLDPETRRAYRVLDGCIPNMLVEESIVLEQADWEAKLAKAGAKPAAPGDIPRRRKPRSGKLAH